MHYNWVVYQEGLRKLQETGLAEMVNKGLRKHEKSLCPSHLSDPEEVLELFEVLKEEGYFESVPMNFVRDFGEDIYQDWHSGVVKLVSDFASGKNSFWEIDKKGEKHFEPMEMDDDFPILSGYNASVALGPELFWDFKKFGFESLGDFLGTLGAYTRMESKAYIDRGYKWPSNEGQRIFQIEIGGSEHGDFRLSKKDITPYKTLDPTGLPVLFRPECLDDVQYIAGSHSVEPYLLSMILQWAEQEKIPSTILDNRQDFIAGFKQQGQYCGPFADFGYESGSGQMFNFLSWDIPLRRVGEVYASGFIPHYLPCYGGDAGGYSLKVGKESQLVFSYVPYKGETKNLALEVQPKDLDQFINGLFTQAQRGWGRTSVKQLVGVIEYRFSEEFAKEREKYI